MRAIRFAILSVALLFPALSLAAPAKPAPPAPPTAAQQLDALFVALAKADSTEDAKPIEDRIDTLFNQSGSATVDLLMTRAQAAIQANDTDTARKLFESVTDVAPDFAEGWHNRAALQAMKGDDRGAMVSLQKTLTLNPREFAAYGELAGMLEDYGDKKGALAAYRRAQALDPKFEDIDRHIRELSRDVEGQGI